MQPDRVAEVASEERDHAFRAGLAELRSFLSMADQRLQRLASVAGEDASQTRHVDELRLCLKQVQSCIDRAGPPH